MSGHPAPWSAWVEAHGLDTSSGPAVWSVATPDARTGPVQLSLRDGTLCLDGLWPRVETASVHLHLPSSPSWPWLVLVAAPGTVVVHPEPTEALCCPVPLARALADHGAVLV